MNSSERLTFEGNFCDIALCVDTDCAEVGCSQKLVWERLKAYEDIGFSPEEIKAAIADIPHVGNYCGNLDERGFCALVGQICCKRVNTVCADWIWRGMKRD